MKAEHSDPPSSLTSTPPTEGQLQAELIKLRKENHALRYTVLGENPAPLDAVTPVHGVKKEEPGPEPQPRIKLELDPVPNTEPTSQSLDGKVDLRAVLQRVKDLFAENTELGRLLVGEVQESEESGRWTEVLRGEFSKSTL